MSDRQRRHTIAPSQPPTPPEPLNIRTKTTNMGEYGLPASVTKDERKLIADAIKAVSQKESETDMAKLDLYLSELETRGLTTYQKEIRSARQTVQAIMRAGGDWKALMTQSEEHWLLNPMITRL